MKLIALTLRIYPREALQITFLKVLLDSQFLK